jgi:hypothetical protein
MTLDEIIAALEKADGPSPDLDRAIADAVLTEPQTVHLAGAPIEIQMWRYPDGSVGSELRFTSSLDAALTLVPEGWTWTIEQYASFKNFGAKLENEMGDEVEHDVYPAPPSAALALCIASLRARMVCNAE